MTGLFYSHYFPLSNFKHLLIFNTAYSLQLCLVELVGDSSEYAKALTERTSEINSNADELSNSTYFI